MPRTTSCTSFIPNIFSSSTSRPSSHKMASAPSSPPKSTITTRPSTSRRSPSKRARGLSQPQPSLPPQSSHPSQPHPNHPYQGQYAQPIHPLLLDNDAALLARAADFARTHMSHYDASHDWAHIQRVRALAHRIYAQLPRDVVEKRRYNETLIDLAALLHDICDHKYLDKTIALAAGAAPPQPTTTAALPAQGLNLCPNPGPATTTPSPPQPPSAAYTQPLPRQHPSPLPPPPAPPTSTPRPTTATALLHQTLRNPPLLIPAALALPLEEIIQHVSYSTERRDPAKVRAVIARHPELEIVQDADRLDALGAVGIGRCFTYGASAAAQERVRGEQSRSRGMEDALEHFDEKLLKLEGMMKTVPGKRMARERAERIRTFKRWWQEEAGVVEYGTVRVQGR
ncbi:hypothetical protein FH972_024371 [Carpinus fangiana]|uniref:HD/PDEase domain-containing protein n=1 Tax=Carpinus fangiana TaxID=176857 RepID=A0A5N6KYK7_9ROSI|nr:hypothetical protein FH972_024371 [Carpinus fangiana]